MFHASGDSPLGPGSKVEEVIAWTHPHHPTASRPVLWTLGWWDVVNTETLSEISARTE